MAPMIIDLLEWNPFLVSATVILGSGQDSVGMTSGRPSGSCCFVVAGKRRPRTAGVRRQDNDALFFCPSTSFETGNLFNWNRESVVKRCKPEP